MSMYKVIYNYTTEVLDFLREKEQQFTTIQSYQEQISGNSAEQGLLITKMSDICLRIQVLYNAKQQQWAAVHKKNTGYLAMDIVLIILVFFIMITLFYFKYKELKKINKGESNIVELCKSGILYLTVFFVILTAMVAIILRVQNNRTFSNPHPKNGDSECSYLANEYGTLWTNGNTLLSASASPKDLNGNLIACGYLLRGTKTSSIINNYLQYYNVISGNSANSGSTGSTSAVASPPVNYIGNTAKATYGTSGSTVLITDLVNTLIAFYDRGNGYNIARQNYVISNPLATLSEANMVMKTYYNLSTPPYGITTDSNVKMQTLLKTDVIQPLIIMPLLDNFVETPSNMSLPTYSSYSNVEFLDFEDATVNIANFAYTCYKGAPNTSMSFKNSTGIQDNNTYAILSSSSNNKLYYTSNADGTGINRTLIRTAVIDAIANATHFSSLAIASQSTTSTTSTTGTTVSVGTPVTSGSTDSGNTGTSEYSLTGDNTYTNSSLVAGYNSALTACFSDLMGSLLYPFYYTYDQSYLDITQFPSYSFTSDHTFQNIFFTSYSTFITNLKQQKNIKSIVLASKVDVIANNIINLNLDLYDYKQFVIQSLTNATPNYSAQNTIVYPTIIAQIQTAVLNKQLLLNAPVIDPRFATVNDFTTKINSMTFNGLVTGLNTQYLNFIIKNFYTKISSAINQNSHNTNNIYLHQNNKFEIWKTTIIMIIIIFALIWVYYIIVIIQELNKDRERLSKREIDANSKTDAIGRKNALEDYFKEYKTMWMFFWFKFLIPTCFIIFVLAIIKSYQDKAVAAFSFNSQIIEGNTDDLTNALDELNNILQSIKLSDAQSTQTIGSISSISNTTISEIYNQILIIIDRFEKCNYIIESQNTSLPFPYTEVIMDVFMLAAIFVCIVFIYVKLKPISRLFTIRDLNAIKKDVEFASKPKLEDIKIEVDSLRDCHDADIESIWFTLKIIFLLFIVMFLIFYTTKVISSTSEFEQGLYNSRYYSENTCYE